MLMKQLEIAGKVLKKPVMQGGMGIGVSLSRLAGAVAKEDAVGIISAAQIGFDEADFEKNPHKCNLRAIGKHISKAKEIAGGRGLIGVNVMVAMKHYREYVKEAARKGADLIVCGAGLPKDLPGVVAEVEGSKAAIAPIVSSCRAASLILKLWDKRYKSTADLIVLEGPEAGGHLGFSKEELMKKNKFFFDEELGKIVKCKKIYEDKYGKYIPIFVAGGIFNKDDVRHVMELGADGVQVASRFVATVECDAAEAYKKAYIEARDEDAKIIVSPVGMPGRALRNGLIKKLEDGRVAVKKCLNCIEGCNPLEIPYCITSALISAVKGDVENGLIFCGANVGRINKMTTVKDIISELYI